MVISEGLLKGARWRKANASGGAMTPRWIVIHDTAGQLRPGSSVDWFSSKECTTSAHFVVERDGTITQMVPTNRRAFHAGQSSWKGTVGLNSCSVGIEIVNPGKLDNTGKAWFGPAAEPSEIVKKSSSAHGVGYWLPYTPEQIAAVTSICRAMIEEYPDCNEIVTHWEISPGRKIDPNPLFPLEELRRAVFDPKPAEVVEMPPPEAIGTPPPPPTIAKEAAKSPSVWALLSVILAKISDFFFGIFDWMQGRLEWIVSVLKSTEAESRDVVAPLVSLGETLKVNLGKVTIWLTVGVLAVVVARHVKDKVEKARLKQQIPGSTP